MVSTSGVPNHPGCIAAIWRYPVKSMMGEELDVAAVTERGLFGDRAFALIDSESGDDRLSDRLGRSVRLTASVPEAARAEGYWPDYHWLEQPDAAFDFQMPPGTFFDGAPIHLVTTATLHQLALLAPKSRFDVPRFRPNFVIDCADSAEGFVENDWIGRTLSIGSEVRLLVVSPTPRCVMTTLPQRDLPKDPDILRTAVQNNQGNVGVYATVIRGGSVKRGDVVTVC